MLPPLPRLFFLVTFLSCAIFTLHDEPRTRAMLILLGVPQTGGILGFYQGYKATVIRDVPYTMMELGLYDLVKSSLKNELLSAAVIH